MQEDTLLTEEERDVDVCVLGTGLTESLLAAALARQGKRVLHIDREAAYGGNWRALPLSDLLAWVSAETTPALPPAGDAGGEASLQKPTAEQVAAPPDRDIAGFTAIPLDWIKVPSCFSDRRLAWDPFAARSAEEVETLRQELLKRSNQFSIDLVPRLLFGRCDMVDVLIESGVARYLEFQGLKSSRVLTSQGLLSVPLTKSDIFQDPFLTLPEKRALMRFVTSMAPFVGSLAFASPAQLGVDNARKVPAPSEPLPSTLENVDFEEPWHRFLERQKLSSRLQDFLTYAICLWDWVQPGSTEDAKLLTVQEGLRRLGRFVSSLGMYGRGTSMPLLYPMYGAAEVAQGFTRMCAIHRGTYALRTCMTTLLASEGEKGGDGWRVAGIVTHRGEVINCKGVVASCDHILEKSAEEAPMPPCSSQPSSSSKAACRRLTVLVDCPLLAEDGLTLCVVPPSALDPPLANVVQALQLDWSTGTCPKGYYVVHLSQAVSTRELHSNGMEGFGDLHRALAVLLSHCGPKERDGGDDNPNRHCILQCSFLQVPRSPVRWDASRGDTHSAVLASCSAGGTLVVSTDPAAVPQLLAGEELDEARDIFRRVDVYSGELPDASDFLKKPAHVAEEERGSTMEALAAFNEEMQAMPSKDAATDKILAAHVATDEAAAPATGELEESRPGDGEAPQEPSKVAGEEAAFEGEPSGGNPSA